MEEKPKIMDRIMDNIRLIAKTREKAALVMTMNEMNKAKTKEENI